MPIYEYVCEQDGTVIELLRPMAQADDPVADPDGRGRQFKRQHSTFASGGKGTDLLARQGGCCPCGKRAGGCGGH
jgi:putative FmdB family regulatory protein